MLFRQFKKPGGKHRHNDNGFTIIEVLIALTIFAIGILGVAKIQTTSIDGNASARMHTEATIGSADRVERLLALPYDHADLNAAANPHQIVNGRYTIDWVVTDNTPRVNTKTVNVSVTWTKRGVRRITIDFIKANI